MKLVQLVSRNGSIIYANPAHVAYVRASRNDKVSFVHFVGLPACAAVRGTPAEVAKTLASD